MIINMNPYFPITSLIGKITNSAIELVINKLRQCIIYNVCRLYYISILDGGLAKNEIFY